MTPESVSLFLRLCEGEKRHDIGLVWEKHDVAGKSSGGSG
jgi:hypothetical protein